MLGGWVALGCGPSTDDPPAGSGSSSSSGEAATADQGSTAADATTAIADDSGSGGSSGTGAPALPCAWVEGQFEAEIPGGATPSNVICDPQTMIATIRLTDDDGLGCGATVGGDRLEIELPPERQVAGEHDLTELVARVHLQADLEPVSGQVDTGTLVITEVTPTAIVGWAHGGLDGYDFVSAFEAPYCP